MAMDLHDTLMGSVLVISGGLTFAYTRAASKIRNCSGVSFVR
jgi:hypothetical protein